MEAGPVSQRTRSRAGTEAAEEPPPATPDEHTAGLLGSQAGSESDEDRAPSESAQNLRLRKAIGEIQADTDLDGAEKSKRIQVNPVTACPRPCALGKPPPEGGQLLAQSQGPLSLILLARGASAIPSTVLFAL